VLCGNVFAQPKPWTFGENVVISPNLYTGTMQLAIPFYTYKDADFEIPVNFGYASSGCIANVRGGIMGPGWGLNAGGSITREIRGIPDEKYYSVNQVYGFYFLYKISKIIHINYLYILNSLLRFFLIPGGTISNNIKYVIPAILYCNNGDGYSSPKYDSEPDIFHFNFMGYSGSFHLGFNGEIHIYNTNFDSKNFKIEIEESNETEHLFAAIKIYTPDGYKYVFNCDRQSSSVALSSSMDEDATPSNDNKGEAIAWNLTKIVSPNGRFITFEYEQCKIISFNPSNFYWKSEYYSVNLCNVMGYTIGSGNLKKKAEHLFYKTVSYIPFLKTINIKTDNNYIAEIKFNYVSQNSLGKEQYRAFKSVLTYIDDGSVKLSGITVNSKLNDTTTKIKECNLTYMQNTNGARTSYLKDIIIQGDGTYTMAYLNWNNSAYPYPASGTFSVDHWGYYNGRNNNNSTNYAFLNITNLDANLNETVTSNYRNYNIDYTKCGVLKQITYPHGEHLTFEYEVHDYGKSIKRLSVNNFNPQLVTEIGYCGGLRIKSIKNYSDSNEGSIMSTKTYIYKSNNVNSGILLNTPRYYIKYSAHLNNNYPIYVNDLNTELISSDLTTFNNTHIEYSKVCENLNDGSKIEYNFTNSQMSGYKDTISYIYTKDKQYYISTESYGLWDITNPTNHTTLNNIVAPVVSKQFIRGRLLKTEVFSNSSSITPIYTETNDYYNEYTNSQTYVPHYYVRALGYTPVYTGKYAAKSSTQTQRVNNVDVSKTNSCTYNSYGQVASQTTTDSRGITQTVEYKYVTDTTTNPNGTRTIDLMVKHNVINLPLREEVYIIENGIKTKIGGRRYTYFNPVSSKPATIRLQQVDVYDSETGLWIADAKYNYYDSYGNLLEKEDSNGLKTSYVYMATADCTK
jgi:hypothetical protein